MVGRGIFAVVTVCYRMRFLREVQFLSSDVVRLHASQRIAGVCWVLLYLPFLHFGKRPRSLATFFVVGRTTFLCRT